MPHFIIELRIYVTRQQEIEGYDNPMHIIDLRSYMVTQLDVQEGDRVKVQSRRGEITAKTQLTERVEPGVVFMPFHFAESFTNMLTNPAYDPIAKIPELKVCAVRVEKAAEARTLRKVGAGKRAV